MAQVTKKMTDDGNARSNTAGFSRIIELAEEEVDAIGKDNKDSQAINHFAQHLVGKTLTMNYQVQLFG